jgi:5'-deoxynucleotidase
MEKQHTFFALLSRQKYINRWALMRNSREESLAEHSYEVSMLAHALCVIANTRYGRHLDANKAAVVGLYHDSSEIITGDMPTPVKYYGEEIKNAYKNVEAIAESTLLTKLPSEMKPCYEEIFRADDDEDERYMRRLVKAADKISAYIKTIEEEKSGNTEFKTAKTSTEATLKKLMDELPEVRDFMEEFIPPYGHTLDELTR